MSASGRATPFVGRERELVALQHQLQAAAAGAGSVALVAGEAGIGKTRLVTELADRAQQEGWTVLAGRAHQADGMPPYLPWVDALRGYVRNAPATTLREALGDYGAEVAMLVRELRTRLPDLPEPPAASAATERYRLFEAVCEFIVAIARGVAAAPAGTLDGSPSRAGLLLVLDDLHWADAPSLLLLSHLARRLRDAPLLVAGTFRDDEVDRGHPLAALLAELVREQAGEQIVLRGLEQEDIARFIELTAPSAESAAAARAAGLTSAVYRETEGNPLFVTELVRLLAAEGRLVQAAALPARLTVPQTVRQVIGRRLDRLSADCNAALTLAAVAGREFDLVVVERAGELRGDRLLEAFEEAEAARVIAAVPTAPGRYNFTHPLIRDTLYEQILTSRRVRLHRQVGEALEAFHSANPEPRLTELAYHFYQAAPGGDAAKAIAYARQAGDRSLALFAYEEAIRLHEIALQALTLVEGDTRAERCGLLLALAGAQTRAGQTTTAKETFRRAAELARALGNAEHLAVAALGYGGYRGIPGLVDGVLVALLEEASAALGEVQSGLQARVLARLAMELYHSDDRERRAALSRQAVAIARDAGDQAALAAALVGRHYALHEPENLPERRAAAEGLIRLAESAGDREVALQGHYLAVIDALEAGDIGAVDANIAAHDRIAQEVRQPLYTWRTDLLLAMQAQLEGRFAESRTFAQRAYEVSQRAQIANSVPAYGTQLAVLTLEVGGFEKIESLYQRFIEQFPTMVAYKAGLTIQLARMGRTAEARALFDELAVADFLDLRHDDSYLTTLTCLAEIGVILGDVRRAAGLYPLLLPYAERNVVLDAAVACLGPAARYLGMLAAVLGRWDEAEAHFAAAGAMIARIRAHSYRAHLELDRALLLERRNAAGDRARAAAHARSAREQAQARGMLYLAGRAEAVLQRLAEPAADSAVAAAGSPLPDGLTVREAEVLRLLATGRTNREIADDLVLSTRTVDHHLAAIYRKVGAKRRGDAIAYALHHGLTHAAVHSP